MARNCPNIKQNRRRNGDPICIRGGRYLSFRDNLFSHEKMQHFIFYFKRHESSINDCLTLAAGEAELTRISVKQTNVKIKSTSNFFILKEETMNLFYAEPNSHKLKVTFCYSLVRVFIQVGLPNHHHHQPPDG